MLRLKLIPVSKRGPLWFCGTNGQGINMHDIGPFSIEWSMTYIDLSFFRFETD